MRSGLRSGLRSSRVINTMATLPAPLLAALLDRKKAVAERTNVVHQLNEKFLGAASFVEVEAMAAQACRGDVVMAACELLVSGDALGWMVLVFLRYVGYAEGALPVLHRAGVIGAVLGMMRGYEPEDHQLRLSLELLTLLFQMPPEWGASWDRAPPARLERPLAALIKGGACGMLCNLLKAAPDGEDGEAVGAMIVALLQLLLSTKDGRERCAKAGLQRIVDEQFPAAEAAAVRKQLARDG